MPQITVDQFLTLLRDGGGPLGHQAEGVEAVQEAWHALAKVTAAFVDTCRAADGVGYAFAREVLEEMTHTFPVPPKDPNSAINDIGNGMAVVNLLTATDEELEQVSRQSGIPIGVLKARQMMARAKARKAEEAKADPAGQPDPLAELEKQFRDDPEAA
jgi:hypothetical protein